MVRSMVPWTGRLPQPFERFENEMAGLMDRFFGTEERWGNGGLTAFHPHIDFAETANAYEVTVELPGLKPEDFHVEYHDGGLWISGERKEETEEKGKTFHRVERHYGQFQRMIPLPGAIDDEKG